MKIFKKKSADYKNKNYPACKESSGMHPSTNCKVNLGQNEGDWLKGDGNPDDYYVLYERS